MTFQEIKPPVCEAICNDIQAIGRPQAMPTKFDEGFESALELAEAAIRNHFAALSVEDMEEAISEGWDKYEGKLDYRKSAQSIMQLLRKE